MKTNNRLRYLTSIVVLTTAVLLNGTQSMKSAVNENTVVEPPKSVLDEAVMSSYHPSIKIVSYKVTNRYTRQPSDEVWNVYEFDVEQTDANPAQAASNREVSQLFNAINSLSGSEREDIENKGGSLEDAARARMKKDQSVHTADTPRVWHTNLTICFVKRGDYWYYRQLLP